MATRDENLKEVRRVHRLSGRPAAQRRAWDIGTTIIGRSLPPLTKAEVVQIYRLVKAGRKGVDVAELYGVSPATVSNIVAKRTHKKALARVR